MNYLVEPIIATAGTCTCNCLIFFGSHDTTCTKELCGAKSSSGGSSGDNCLTKQFCISPTGVKVSPT